MGGFEPPTSPLPRVCSTPELHEQVLLHIYLSGLPALERVVGIEPTSSAWKAEVIATIPYPPGRTFMVVRGGFEPPKLARQIYSLIPLATREPHQKGADNRLKFYVCKCLDITYSHVFFKLKSCLRFEILLKIIF